MHSFWHYLVCDFYRILDVRLSASLRGHTEEKRGGRPVKSMGVRDHYKSNPRRKGQKTQRGSEFSVLLFKGTRCQSNGAGSSPEVK